MTVPLKPRAPRSKATERVFSVAAGPLYAARPVPRLPFPRLLQRLLTTLALLVFAGAPGAWDADRMQRAAERQGERAAAAVRLLQPLLRDATVLPETERLARVNEFFNRRIVSRDDREVWGRVDHWASPLESLAKGEGDCEDYAIAKYFALVAAGVPVARLRLVYVQAQQGGPQGPVIPHMVLAWYAEPNADPLVLDSLIGDVRPASRRPDLRPVFSFNGDGLWQGAGGPAMPDALTRLSRWAEVQAKARAEGFL